MKIKNGLEISYSNERHLWTTPKFINRFYPNLQLTTFPNEYQFSNKILNFLKTFSKYELENQTIMLGMLTAISKPPQNGMILDCSDHNLPNYTQSDWAILIVWKYSRCDFEQLWLVNYIIALLMRWNKNISARIQVVQNFEKFWLWF